MKEFTEEAKNALSIEQRNLLSVAYKNVVGSRRSSWRVIASIIGKNEGGEVTKSQDDCRAGIVKELKGICQEVLVCNVVV